MERSFSSVATLFSQYVAGYVGRNVDRRGKNADQAAVWSLVELQDLFDEWIVAHWQNRPHEGLRHPLTPDKAMTPNEQYAALLEIAGYVPVPLGGDDYVELLPATWRVINAYGVKINLNIHPLPITAEIVERFGDAALAPLRDPSDRLIVATTLVLGIPLVSADRVIARIAGVDVVR